MVFLWEMRTTALMILNSEHPEPLPGTQSRGAYSKATLLLAFSLGQPSCTYISTENRPHLSLSCPKFRSKWKMKWDLVETLEPSFPNGVLVPGCVWVCSWCDLHPSFCSDSNDLWFRESWWGGMSCVWDQPRSIDCWFSCNSWLLASLVGVKLFPG